MGQTHVLNTPKENQIWFIAGDWHGEHLHIPSYKILKKHAMSLDKKHRNLIINGDFLDTAYLMPKSAEFQQWANRKDGVDEFFLPEWEEEIAWGNKILDELQLVFRNIIFIKGNHDSRDAIFREQYCPIGYKEHFFVEKGLNLEKRNVGHIENSDWLDFGKLSIVHGQYHGSTCHKKHYEACGARNVVFSHVHSSECKTFTVRGESRSSWSIPAMCDLNPHYIKNAETNWQNGYATLCMKPSGRFNLYTCIVLEDTLFLPHGVEIMA